MHRTFRQVKHLFLSHILLYLLTATSSIVSYFHSHRKRATRVPGVSSSKEETRSVICPIKVKRYGSGSLPLSRTAFSNFKQNMGFQEFSKSKKLFTFTGARNVDFKIPKIRYVGGNTNFSVEAHSASTFFQVRQKKIFKIKTATDPIICLFMTVWSKYRKHAWQIGSALHAITWHLSKTFDRIYRHIVTF